MEVAWPEATNRRHSQHYGPDEGEPVAVTYSTDESSGQTRYHPHCDVHAVSLTGTWEFRSFDLIGKGARHFLSSET